MEIVPAAVTRALRIVLPGGSGQVGQMLARHFQERGHHVTVLTRGPYTAPWQTVHWDGKHTGPWIETLEGADVCINLAGRSVNCRYNATNRAAIYNSRIGTTRLLHYAIARLENPPWVWLNASTATIYRHALDREMDEATGELGGNELISKRRRAPETWDFSIRVAKDWEAAFFATETPRTRKVALRSAITLSPTPGNAFQIFLNLVRLSLGGKQGNGRQYVSWIHEADFARAVEFLIEHEELDGPVNLAAPHPLPNREFMEALREAWGMPNGLPIPSLAMEIGAFFLRTEPELVLKSRCVVPGRLLDAGFQFEFPEWPEAAEDLVRQWRNRE
ncbi:MAG: TIGR01777 family oxidoreductase [Terracidiphilus sp.]|jgi:uncharacterized protein (TIGR01777 family)